MTYTRTYNSIRFADPYKACQVCDERVVGVISANEIFQLAAHCLGACERHCGVTLAALELGPGVLGRIAAAAEAAGAVLQALYPIDHFDRLARFGVAAKKVVVHFHARDIGEVVCALEAAGFPVLESVEAGHPALAD